METELNNRIQSEQDDLQQPITYDSAELDHIVSILTSGPFDIDYIILFGKLAGGTPFSGIAAYDLLVVTDETPAYDWRKVKRYLRYHIPIRQRDVSYHNIYIMSRRQSVISQSPVPYVAHTEGKVIYSRIEEPLLPKRSCDFPQLHTRVRQYFQTVLPIGKDYIAHAEKAYTEDRHNRTASLLASQAAALFYRTLHYVYYAEEIDTDDLIVMHDKLRTLDGELMLLFDGTHIGPNTLLPTMQGMRKRLPFDPASNLVAPVLEACMGSVRRLGEIVEAKCRERIKLYRSYF